MLNTFNKYLGKFIFLILFWFCFFQPNTVHATHIVGGNLTYKYISGNRYQVKLVLRRDCFLGSPEAEFDNPASIAVFTAGGDLAKWLPGLTNGQILIPFMASDTLNEFIRSDCGFEGTQVCVHETTYQGFVDLPTRPGGYILAYQRCCRNASLNNIIEPLETGSTYWVALGDRAMSLRNNSPTFNQWPDVYICANKPLNFDHSATDVDGDSLVYKLCLPNSGGTRIDPKPQPANFPPFPLVQFKAPYSLNDVMGGEALKLDPKTGIMTANPNLVGQFLVGVCVEEYRNGQLIGVVRRDFQFNVRVCSQPPKAQFTTSEFNCDGLRVEFYNSSLASNTYQWNFNFPSNDPAFQSTQKDPVFTFPKSGVYNVLLRAVRGSDQCFDTIIQKVSVFENKIEPEFSYRLNGCDLDKDSLTILLTDNSIFNEPGYQISSWQWKVTQNGVETNYTGRNPDIFVADEGNITVELLLQASNGCQSSLLKTIDILELVPKLDFEVVFTGCPEQDSIQLNITNTSQAINPLAILDRSDWVVGAQLITGNVIQVTLPKDLKEINIRLDATFKEACDVSLSKTIDLTKFTPRLDAVISPVGCPDNDSVTIKIDYIDTLSNGIAFNDLIWNAGVISNTSNYTGQSIWVTIPKDSVLTFSLEGTFTNGCNDRITRSELPGPFATLKFEAGPIILCPGESKDIITNGNADWTYTWSPTEGLDLSDPANPKVKSDINRTYLVTVTDGLCSVIDSVDVIALTGGVNLAIVGDTVTCDGTIELMVSGGVGNGVYSWGTEPNVTNVIATGTTVKVSFSGTESEYFVKFIGDACSTEPARIKVKNQAPSIDDLSPITFCKSDTSKVLLLNLIADHNNTYNWGSSPNIISGGNTNEPIIGIGPNELGPVVLNYIVTNQFGCSIKDSILINIGENPVADFDFKLTECGLYEICFNYDGDAKGFVAWNFGDPNTEDDKSLQKAPCYVYPNSGTYTITLSNVTSVCPFKDVVKTVTLNPQIVLENIPDQVLCAGDSINIKAISNLSNVIYEWLDANGNVISNSANLQLLSNVTSQYVIKGTDIYGCTDRDTVNIDIFKFSFDVDVKDSLCLNTPTQITLNIAQPQDYEILWSPSDCIVSGGNTVSPVILPVLDKQLSVVLRHKPTGCTDTAKVSPKIAKPFSFDVETPDLLCFDQASTIKLNIQNPDDFTYLWSPADCFTGGTTGTTPTLKLTKDKVVNVIVTKKSSGCRQNMDVPVTVGELVVINVDAEPNAEIYEGQSAELVINNFDPKLSYLWSTNERSESIIVSPRDETTYTVTVTDANGCTAVDEVTVTVRKAKCDETDVFLPTAFTPNGDGTNDLFIVRSNFLDEAELIIYNRWGQEVFNTKDKNIGWDGTFNGTDLPPDSYAYYLRALCINAEEYRKRGNVTLIR
jgi:gliding motility-associated-like protein